MRAIVVGAAWMVAAAVGGVTDARAAPPGGADPSAVRELRAPSRIAAKKKKKPRKRPVLPETPAPSAPDAAPPAARPAQTSEPPALPPKAPLPPLPQVMPPLPPADSASSDPAREPGWRGESSVGRSALPDRAEPGTTTAAAPQREQALPALIVLVEPEWAYRRFLDIEPSATNKSFGTAGVFLIGGRVELYPLAAGNSALRDLGVSASYARGLSQSPGLAITDLNSDKSVDTQWYRYFAGLKYRALGRSGPFQLAVFTGLQRWVFDFDLPVVPTREIPTARYFFLEGGADGRYSFGAISLLLDAAYLQPLLVEPLGDRKATSRGYGVQGGLGAAFKLGAFEADLRATYTLVRLSLEPAPGRSDEPGRVFDQYFGARLSLGASF